MVSILSRLLACPWGSLLFACSSLTPRFMHFGQPASSAASFAPKLLPAGSDRAGDRQDQVLAKRPFQLICFPSLWARLPTPFIPSSFQPTGSRFLLPVSPVAWPCPCPSPAPAEVQGFSPVLHGCPFVHGNFPPGFCSLPAWRCLPVPAPCQLLRVIFGGCQRTSTLPGWELGGLLGRVTVGGGGRRPSQLGWLLPGRGQVPVRCGCPTGTPLPRPLCPPWVGCSSWGG